MGSEKQLSYTVIGDNVNLAARVMSVAKGMQMFITRTTYERVKDFFIIEQRESIMVKGKSMPIEIFEVMGVNPEADLSKFLTHGAGKLAGGDTSGSESESEESRPVRKEEPDDEESQKQNIQIDDKPKVIECQNCGTENDMQEKFCVKCGMPIF
jgi:hypothetical protein